MVGAPGLEPGTRWLRVIGSTGQSDFEKSDAAAGSTASTKQPLCRSSAWSDPDRSPTTDRDVAIGIGSIWRFFDREGVSLKKMLLPSERDGPDLARRRASWLILPASSSSMRLGPRPTWSAPTAGDWEDARACSVASHRTQLYPIYPTRWKALGGRARFVTRNVTL